MERGRLHHSSPHAPVSRCARRYRTQWRAAHPWHGDDATERTGRSACLPTDDLRRSLLHRADGGCLDGAGRHEEESAREPGERLSHATSQARLRSSLAPAIVSSIGPLDIFYKLFNEDQVVVCKMNPVNAYLGPLIEVAFRALIDGGYLRIVYGGAEEGAYLCNHPGVDEIHITGSDKTFDAIVWGPGAEGAARKATGQPLLTKRITGELGNVSPVIVVPGNWSASDIQYQAEHLVSMLTINAGFNCNATRVIVTHAGWKQRDDLLKAIRAIFAKTPSRAAYYPGARDRHAAFVGAHPEADQFGSPKAMRYHGRSSLASPQRRPTISSSLPRRSVASSPRPRLTPPAPPSSSTARWTSPTTGSGARSTLPCSRIPPRSRTRRLAKPSRTRSRICASARWP